MRLNISKLQSATILALLVLGFMHHLEKKKREQLEADLRNAKASNLVREKEKDVLDSSQKVKRAKESYEALKRDFNRRYPG